MNRNMRRMVLTVAALGILWTLARAQALPFQYHGLLSRVITPNGDQRNDMAIVCFDNFSDASVEGVIYTPLGSEVSRMTQQSATPGCPGGSKPQSLTWDGRAYGSVVASGIYIYRVRTELRQFTGALLVVR